METRVTIGLGILLALVMCAGSFGADFDLNFSLENLTLGQTLLGKPWRAEELAYRVVLVEFWGINCPPCRASLPTLSSWQDEYKSQGLVVIGVHCQRGSNESVRSLAKEKGVTFTIVANGDVKGANFRGIPHCFLFDSTGKCIYRGGPHGALEPLKGALAKAPFAALGGRELVKLRAISEALKRGMPPGAALKKAESLVDNADEETADEAGFVVESLTQWGQKLIKEATAKKESDPLNCVLSLRKIQKSFDGTELAKKASGILSEFDEDEGFQAELGAYRTLQKIKALEAKVVPLRTPAGDDTTSDTFKRINYATLKKIYGGVRMLRKKYPDAKATAEAEAIARKFGLLKG